MTAQAGKPSVLKHMLSGSLWALAMRWSIRGLGLISVVILARLLTPEDFGIVAMGALLIGLIDGFAELGTAMLLLRRSDITREDCDTAWTLRLIQGLVIGTLLAISAPFAVRYFSEPRLEAVIYVLALGAVVGAGANIGMTLVRKDLDFAKDFRFGVYQKLGGFFPTLLLAFWLRDYWALAFGNLVGTIVGVILSFRMHPYRPRLCLAKVRDYLEFSVAVVGANIARFLKGKVDVLVIGGTTNTASMGAYNVASELAYMATQEIVIPIWRGLFPSFAKITHDKPKFITAYRHYLNVMAMVCLPLGFGLWAVADNAVGALLGDQWHAAVPALRWLAIGATLIALIDVFSGNILFVSGHERRAAVLTWVHLAVLVPSVLVAGTKGGVEAVAAAATLSAAAILPLAVIVLMRSIGFPFAMLASAVWRPVVAVAVMVFALQAFALPVSWPPLLRLIPQVLTGGAVYCISLACLWAMTGRPEGAESMVWRSVRPLLPGSRTF